MAPTCTNCGSTDFVWANDVKTGSTMTGGTTVLSLRPKGDVPLGTRICRGCGHAELFLRDLTILHRPNLWRPGEFVPIPAKSSAHPLEPPAHAHHGPHSGPVPAGVPADPSTSAPAGAPPVAPPVPAAPLVPDPPLPAPSPPAPSEPELPPPAPEPLPEPNLSNTATPGESGPEAPGETPGHSGTGMAAGQSVSAPRAKTPRKRAPKAKAPA